MARARNLKPGLLKNEILGVADPLYTLLFEGLWILADREGRLEDRPLRIKAEVFPYREGINADAMLTWLADAGFILRYEANGSRYIQVVEFAKHQNPHKDEKKSEIPAPNLHGARRVQEPSLHETYPADSLFSDSLSSDSLSKPSDGRKKRAPSEDPEFDEAYALYPRRPGSSKASALKAWRARRAAGVEAAAMIAGVKRYTQYVALAKTEPNFIKMPATFFGPDRHFDADWTFVPRTGPPDRRDEKFDPVAYVNRNRKS